MPATGKTKTAFTLIEFLIALVIIGFIVAILVGVFSSPLKQAKTDAAISQIKDGLRQYAEAVQLRNLRTGEYYISYPTDFAQQGYLTAEPALPAWITDGVNPVGWEFDEAWPFGGCEPGRNKEVVVYAKNVSAEFCLAYNAAQGITGIGINCADASTPCAVSTDSSVPVPQNATSFCFSDDSTHNIITLTGLQREPCP